MIRLKTISMTRLWSKLRHYCAALVFCMTALFASAIAAQSQQGDTALSPILVDKVSEFHTPIAPYTEYFADPSGSVPVQEALKREDWAPLKTTVFSDLFLPASGAYQSDFAIWARFRVTNQRESLGIWRIDTKASSLGNFQAHIQRNSGEIVTVANDSYGGSFNQRAVPSEYHAADIALSKGETAEIYIYIKDEVRDLNIWLVSPDVFFEQHNQRTFWYSSFFGALLVLFVLAVLAGGFTGWKPTAAFCATVLCSGLFVFNQLEWTHRFVLPNQPNIDGALYYPLFAAVVCAVLNMGYTLFDIERFSTIYKRVFEIYLTTYFLVCVCIVTLINLYIEIHLGEPTPLKLNLQIALLVRLGGMLACIFHLTNICIAIYTRQKGGVPFLISGLAILFSVLLTTYIPDLFSSFDAFAGLTCFLALLESSAFASAMVLRALGIKRERDAAVLAELELMQQKFKLTENLRARERDYKQALETSEQRRSQLASVSHDILQPLHALRASLLEVRPRNEDSVQKMHEAYDYLEELARDSLKDSRPDIALAGSREVFPVSAVLDNVVRMFEPEAKAKGLSFRYRPSEQTLSSDPIKLMRIISNLVSNAIKYTDGGGVLIATRRRAEGIHICVWDTGAGMTDEQLAAYSQAYSKSDHSDGTGLGLHLVKTMCDELGHEFEIRSAAGRGVKACVIVRHPSQN